MAVFNKAVMTESAYGRAYDDVSVFDVMIESERLDQSLFESLIEVDFAEAYNEAGIIVLTEEEQAAAGEAQKKGIFSKIWEAIKKAGRTIAELFDRLFNFITNLLSNDKGHYKKYENVMNYAKVMKCPVKGKYVNFKYYDKIKKTMDIYAGGSASLKNTAIWNDSGAGTETSIDFEELIKSSDDKTIMLSIGSENFKSMVDLVKTGYRAEMNEAKATKKNALDMLKELENEYKKAANSSNKDTASSAKEIYDRVGTRLKHATTLSSKYTSMVTKAVAVNRACFLKIGAWALKAEKDTSKANDTSAKDSDKKVEERPYEYENMYPNQESAAVQEARDFLIDLTNEIFIESLIEEA